MASGSAADSAHTPGRSGADTGGRALAAARARAPAPAEHRGRTSGQTPGRVRGTAPDERAARQPSSPPSTTYLARHLEADEWSRRVRAAVDLLAPSFGLDPARVRVTVSPLDGAAKGAASGDTIAVFGSPTAGVLPLLAHELVHTRQHRNRATVTPDVTAAEAEAAGLANALREGRRLWVPREALPDGHVARDDGATGIATATAHPSIPPTRRRIRAPRSSKSSSTALVRKNHSGDIKTLKGLLDHPWTQTQDYMIENCLRILATLQFVVARALVRALDGTDRIQLALLNDDHHAAYPEQCIAVLSALTTGELSKLSGQITGPDARYPGATAALHGVAPGRLGATSRRALMRTLVRVGAATRFELVNSDRRDVFRALFSSGPDSGTDLDDLQKAIDSELVLETQEKGVDNGTVAQVRTALGSANAETVRGALDLLQALAAKTAPVDMTPFVTAVLPSMPSQSPPAPPPKRGNEPAPVSGELAATVAQLDSEGLIDKILDHVDPDDRNGAYQQTLHTVLSARAPLPNLSRATELLSYSLSDWAVTDDDARFAYLLVRSTPVLAQDTWRQLENGKWLHRLEDNIPDDMFTSGEYTGVGSEYIAVPPQIPGLSPQQLQGKAEEIIKRWDADRGELNAQQTIRTLLGQDEKGMASPWDHDRRARRCRTTRRIAPPSSGASTRDRSSTTSSPRSPTTSCSASAAATTCST